MGNNPARVVAAVSTLGATEVVRLIDEDTGKALETVVPAAALTKAITTKELRHLNPVANTHKVIATATRNVPIVNDVTDTLAKTGAVLDPLTHIDSLIRKEKKVPKGLAYACALASYMAYIDPMKRDNITAGDQCWVSVSLLPLVQPPFNHDIEHGIYVALWKCKSDPTKYMLAYRGTADGRDVKDDAYILLTSEQLSVRFNLSLKFAKDVREHFQIKELIITGHSLGGSIAFHCCSKMKDTKGHVFNAGYGVGNLLGMSNVAGPLKSLLTNWSKIPDRVVHHHVASDPVSQLWPRGMMRLIEYPNSECYAHLMGNFVTVKDQQLIDKTCE